MNARQLIKKLEAMNPETEVAFFDPDNDYDMVRHLNFVAKEMVMVEEPGIEVPFILLSEDPIESFKGNGNGLAEFTKDENKDVLSGLSSALPSEFMFDGNLKRIETHVEDIVNEAVEKLVDMFADAIKQKQINPDQNGG